MAKNGFTLVELLIGMLIGMLCMIMMLMLFKQISRVGLVSARDAEYDAQLETGVLMAHKLIQNAGYGSGKAADLATGFVQLNSTTNKFDAKTSGQPAIFWRVATDTSGSAFECYGLSERITTSGINYIHRLVMLKKSSCNGVGATTGSDLKTMTDWIPETIVKVSITADEVNQAATNAGITSIEQANKRIFTFNPVVDATGKYLSCAPFGIQDVQGGAKVTITGNRLNVTSGLGQSIQRAVCLHNIPVS